MRNQTVQMALLLIALLGIGDAALAGTGTADMTFHGTLIAPPPCRINDGEQIDVDFGERVGINRVDGENYRRSLNYQITCEEVGSGWALNMSLSGTAAVFDREALQTNKADLGIRIYQNGVPLTPNSIVKIDPVNPPDLEAVPVKKVGKTLTEGVFEAWATLQADYL